MRFVVLTCALLLLITGELSAQNQDAEKFSALLSRSQQLFDHEKYSDAIPALEAVARAKPNLPGAHYQLGFAYWRLGRTTEAIRAFTEELKLPPPDPYSLYYLGRIYLERNAPARAARYFEDAVKAGGVLDARQRLGAVYLKLGRLQDATDVLLQAIEKTPGDESAHYLLGRVYRQTGEGAKAQEQFALARQAKNDTQHSTAALLQLESELRAHDATAAAATGSQIAATADFEAIIKSGQAFGRAGLASESVPLFERAAALQPKSADAYYDLARAYLALNQPQQAIDQAKTAVQLNPALYEAELLLGTALVDSGRGADSIPYLSKAAELRPGNARLFSLLALQYLESRYYREASEALHKSIQLDAQNPDPYFLLIQVEYRSDRYEEALRLAGETAQRFPNLAMSHYHYGVQLQNLNRLDEAQVELRKAIGIDPSLNAAWVALGDVLYKTGKPQASLAEFQSLLARNEGEMDAWTGLGKALIELKMYQDAAEKMRKAIAIDPGVPAPHLYLSQALRALGKRDDSRKEAALFNTLTLQRAHARDQDAERSVAQ